jgi:hypothetical protein
MSIKNLNDTIGNRTHDLPTCSAVPQPTAPPCAPLKPCTLQIICNTYSKTPLDQNLGSFGKWALLGGGDARAAATSSQPNETEQNCISSSPLHVISVCHFPLFGWKCLCILSCFWLAFHILILIYSPSGPLRPVLGWTLPFRYLTVPCPVVWHHVSPDDAGLLELYCINAHGRSSSALGSGTRKC